MPRVKDTTKQGNKGGKTNEEHDPTNDTDPGAEQAQSSKASTSTPKLNKAKQKEKQDKSDKSDNQPTIEKHLKTVETTENTCNDLSSSQYDTLQTTLKGLTDKMSELASQAYIEERFRKIITQEFLNQKLEELKSEVKANINKELDKINKEVGILKDRMTSSETTITQLKNKVSDMETEMDKKSLEQSQIQEKNKEIAKQLEEREIVVKRQAEEINKLEQYTRRNSVRIYGVNDRNAKETQFETAKQVVKLVNEKLDIKISSSDIDVAHRMGRFQENGNRPIICKFVSRYTKHEIIKSRRQLKNTPIVIREDLTLKNAKLLEKTSASDKVDAAWSDEGRVIALLLSGKKVVVDSNTDLNSF